MVVWFIQSFVHRHGGTVVNGPTHIGGDPSKKQVDLRIRIGELFVDGDVHIHNPTSGNNTSKTPFAVTKRAAQDKHKKYEASSKKDGFEFLSLGAEDTGAMDPEFKEFARRLARMCVRQKATLCWWTWTRRKTAMPTRRTSPTKAASGGRLCKAASGGDAEH